MRTLTLSVILSFVLLGNVTPLCRADDAADLKAARAKAAELLKPTAPVDPKKNWENALLAVKELEKALGLAKKVHGENDLETAAVMRELAGAYRRRAMNAEAKFQYENCLKILEDKLGKDHLDVAAVLQELAAVHPQGLSRLAILPVLKERGGNLTSEEPERLYQRCLKIREDKLGKDHLDVAETLGLMANFYKRESKRMDEEHCLERCLRIREEKLGKDHLDTGKTLKDLAEVKKDFGDYTDAESSYIRSLKILEDRLETNNSLVALTWSGLVEVYKAQGKYAAIEPIYLCSLKEKEEKLDKNNPQIEFELARLANFYATWGKKVESERTYHRVVRIREDNLKALEEKLGKDDPRIATELTKIAVLYKTSGNPSAAENAYRRALKIQQDKHGKDSAQVAMSLDTLGGFYLAQEKYVESENVYRQGLTIREGQLEKSPYAISQSVDNLTALLLQQRKYAEADVLFDQLFEIVKKNAKPGKSGMHIGVTLWMMGTRYKTQQKYVEAEFLYRKALAIDEEKYAKDVNFTANKLDVEKALENFAEVLLLQRKYAEADRVLVRLAKLEGASRVSVARSEAEKLAGTAKYYADKGNYDAAEFLTRKSLDLYEKKFGNDHLNIGEVLFYLAELCQRQGRTILAVPHYERALKIFEKNPGEDQVNLTNCLQQLGAAYYSLGQLDKAEPLLQRRLKILEGKHGPDHPEVAHVFLTLADLYHYQGQRDKAEPLYERSLKIFEEKLGNDDLAVAICLDSIAILQQSKKEDEKAHQLFERALKIRIRRLGPFHLAVASSLENLGLHLQSMGQTEQAISHLERSLGIRQQQGIDHPDVARTLRYLACLYARQDRWDDAFKVRQRAQWTLRGHVERTLPSLNEREHLQFLRTDFEEAFYGSLSLGFARGQEGAERSATWLLNGKALSQESLAERALLAKDSADPKKAGVARQLQDIRRQLANIALSAPEAGKEDVRQKKLAELSKQEQDLSTQLTQAGGSSRAHDPWVEAAAVRQVLPADAVLVDIARFRLFNFKAKKGEAPWQPARYVAWIVPPEKSGNVDMVDLGPADKIDKAVQAFRQAMLETQGTKDKKSTILELGEPEAEKKIKTSLQELGQLVLGPLYAKIGTKNRWIVSPDGALWLVPWAALTLPDGKYAVEKHTISYVISGRDLVTPPAVVKTTRPMVLADPDYDLGLAEARAAVKELVNGPTALADLRGAASSSALPLVNRLPGTAAEAAAIKPKLEQYAKDEVWVYKDKNALEAVFKSFKSPKVLVLSTHGFFLEDQEVAETTRTALRSEDSASRLIAAPLTKDGKLFENPLVRCGLLLAGCNDREGGRTETDEDGVLTGLEIVGTDLRGTELVVLSACETGLGQVRNGEGVAGLRQAFQLAGARAVVATLWQISDKETALLMSAFFENLAAGKSKADALREAQLGCIKARRERHGAAHPFYWAAFTLTGQ